MSDMPTRKIFYTLMAVALIAAMAGLRCGTEKGAEPEGTVYGVTPDSVNVEVSSTRQFSVEFFNVPGEAIWYVDGVRGGTPKTGMITPEGLFVAPHEVPPAGFVTITARAVMDSLVAETAKAVIQSGYGATAIQVNPDSVAVVLGDSLSFSPSASGCALSSPTWSIMAISPIDDPTGEMRLNGTYVAPADVPDDIALMVTVESADCPGKKGLARVEVLKPELFLVQFEDFSDSSGVWIRRNVSCGGGDYAVDGLDQPNEWIIVPYQPPAGGEYSAEIRFKSNYEDVLRVTVTEMGSPNSDPPSEVSFVIELGDGIG
jgi:hypothetical protein